MNKYEEMIAALKLERDEKTDEIQQRIESLSASNHNMRQLCQLNHEQIQFLNEEKKAIRRDYKNRIATVYKMNEDMYLDPSAHEHYKRFKEFCELHPEVLDMWKEFRAQEEGGEA